MAQARSQSGELAAAKEHAEGMDAEVLEYLTSGTKNISLERPERRGRAGTRISNFRGTRISNFRY